MSHIFAGGSESAILAAPMLEDFWITCAELGLRAVHVPEPLFYYRLKPQSRNAVAMAHHALLRAQVASKHPRSFGLAGPKPSYAALDQGA